MALQKQIEQENGIILNYHRIAVINKITNMVNVIEINSYINKEQREKEKEYQLLQKRNANGEALTSEEQSKLEKGINVLIKSDYIEMEYGENTNIKDAYEYLKTTEKYKDSVDL